MRYRSQLSIAFDALSDERAREIASAHHAQLHDVLAVEGADHPCDISLVRVCADRADGSTNVLAHDVTKVIR